MIKITCSNCGKKLEAPDSAAGKRGKCPGCGTVFAVTSEKKCPGCGSAYPASTVICTSCGINLETGSRIAAAETGGEAPAEPAAGKPSGGKLVLEGALAGTIMGAFVFLGMLAVEIIWDGIFEGWGTASDGLLLKLLAVVIMGLVVGSIVGIVTVVTRSASAGQVLFIIPLGLVIFHAWRSGIIGSRISPFAWMFAIAGLAFAGWILYVVFGAISQGVLKGIDWEKYG